MIEDADSLRDLDREEARQWREAEKWRWRTCPECGAIGCTPGCPCWDGEWEGE